MAYWVKGDRVHKDPPKCNLKTENAKKVDKIPPKMDKCDTCFNLPK